MTRPKFSQSVQIILLIFFSLLIFHQTIFASTARDTFKKNINFKEGGFLSLANSNGNVEIISWDKDEVEIIAYKEVRAKDRETADRLMERWRLIFVRAMMKLLSKPIFPKDHRAVVFLAGSLEKEECPFLSNTK
jgi:hypothetical protein